MVERSYPIAEGRQLPIIAEISAENVLTTNVSLDRLLKRLGQQMTAIDDVSVDPNARKVMPGVGSYAENYLEYIARRLAGGAPWKTLMQFDTIPPETETPHYVFRKDWRGHYLAVDKKTKNTIAEYDMFTEVDGLPVVWEVKTQSSDNLNSVSRATYSKNIRRLASPLQEYYTNLHPFRMGYVMVTNLELVQPEDPYQMKFAKRGGHMLPLRLTHEQMVERVRHLQPRWR